MKLLITTQAIDEKDDHFVFFLDWVREFAKRYESVTVIALRTGSYTLPKNVEVFSLGKNEGRGRVTYLYRFFKIILKKIFSYDQVFVFMNPEYVVLGGLLWRLFGKRIGLWYTHKQVNFKLRIAHFFAHDIFTAVKESFTIPSKKVHVVGHGINTDLFSPREVSREKVEIVTVSRIAPIKHIELMIEAIPQIENQLGQGVTLTVISKVPEKSDPYYAKLLAMVEDLGLGEKVHFLGAIPGGELPQYYNRASITLNLTPTGGLDKAVLESLSCGVPVIASNQGLQGLFGPFAEQSLVTLGDSGELVEKVVSAIRMTREERIDLRSLVVPAYAYQTLVGKIIAIYETGK